MPSRKKSPTTPPKPTVVPFTRDDVAEEVLQADSITYPDGETVVDANGDEQYLPSDEKVTREMLVMSRFERQQTALTLRIAGATQEQIARRLGVSRESVNKYLQEAMRELTTESSQLLRTVYGRRLEMMLQKHWADALKGDFSAMQAVLSIMDRQFRLYGFDRVPEEETKMLDGDKEIIVLSKETSKDEFISAMQRARKQIEKSAG